MLVRRASEEDMDEVLELDRVCVPGCYWRLDEANALFVIDADDGRVCAYASLRVLGLVDEADRGAAYFDRAGVAPWARGRGLQRQLIRARERWCRGRSVRVGITYTVPTNCASSNNLIRCGWRLYRPENAWGGREALYWKRAFLPCAADVHTLG